MFLNERIFLKERILIEKIFEFYDSFNVISNCEMVNDDFSKKIFDEIKKYENLKLIITSILIINIVFKSILLFINNESILNYIFLIIFSIIFYMITNLGLNIKIDNIYLLLYSTEANSKNGSDIRGIKSIIVSYEDTYLRLKNLIEDRNVFFKDNNDLYKSFVYLGRFATIILSIAYIITNIITEEGLNGIIIFSILMILVSIKTFSINDKIMKTIYTLFQYEVDRYRYNIEILNNIYEESLVNEKKLAFESYSKMLYMLLDLYQVSMEYEFLRDEDVIYLSKEYFANIYSSIDKIRDTTIKNNVKENYDKLKSFMRKNSNEIYNELEVYIGELYKNIRNSFPTKELRVEDYCFTIDEIEALTLLCE